MHPPAPAPFTAFLRRRLLTGALTLWAVVTLIFALVHLLPGDPAETMLAREIRFDPDIWIVEVEDRAGRCFLDLV